MDRYLYYVPGVVHDMYCLTKATLVFTLANKTHRVLLCVKNFIHEGELLEYSDSLQGKIKPGDPMTFHCHPYDRPEERDMCEWYATRAWKSRNDDESLTVVNQQAQVIELDPGKGMLEFNLLGVKEQVHFLRSKYYHFGEQVNKKLLPNLINEGDMVQMDAKRCEPSTENKNTCWFVKVVWKGSKPARFKSAFTDPTGLPSSVARQLADTPDGEEDEDNSISSGSSVGVTRKGSTTNSSHSLYKQFEKRNGSIRDGTGSVVSILNEESGVALWMIEPNHWESVFFHRSVAYLDELSLSEYNLQEPYASDMLLQISAVQATSEFPCKWVARKVVAFS